MSKDYKVTTDVPFDEEDTENLLNLFDQDNPDIAYFNAVDHEHIRLSGSKVQYYKYFQSEDFDDVYGEERNKQVAEQPIEAWAHYDPKPVEENLGEFGIELTNEQIFIFNKVYIEKILGRIPHPGDIVKPKFQNQKYEIYEVQEAEFHAYGVYHLNCFAKLLRDQPDVQDVNIDESQDIGGLLE